MFNQLFFDDSNGYNGVSVSRLKHFFDLPSLQAFVDTSVQTYYNITDGSQLDNYEYTNKCPDQLDGVCPVQMDISYLEKPTVDFKMSYNLTNTSLGIFDIENLKDGTLKVFF
jgi:hypothetical protein